MTHTIQRMKWLTICSALWTSPLGAEDWTEFRGPTGQGQSAAVGLPTSWSAQKNVQWKVPVDGSGWSSPVAADDRIYLTTAVKVGQGADADVSLRALGLDAATGQVLWSREVFLQHGGAATRHHNKNSLASPTPVFSKGRLYVHFGHLGTACLDATDGKVLWSTQAHAYSPVHGNGGSPVLCDGLLIFSADGANSTAVLALDQRNGKLKWRTPRVTAATNTFSFSTPLVIEVEGRRQVVSAGSGVVQSLDPKNGKEIWRVTYGAGFSVVPRPIFAHGQLYVCTGYNKASLLAIRVTPEMSGDVTASHVSWQMDRAVPFNPSLVAVGDDVYCLADNGILSCIEGRTGKLNFQERCTGPASASILHADGKLFLLDERGQGVVVQAGRTMRILAKNELGERSLASQAVIGNDLLIRTAGHLYRIGNR